MDEAELAAAAELCLAGALATKRPFLRVKLFLAKLKADPAWTDAEVIEVQTRIIRALMARLGSRD